MYCFSHHDKRRVCITNRRTRSEDLVTFIEAVLAEGRAASAEVDNVARRAALTDDFAHAVAELRRAAPARTTDTAARQARSNDEGARQARANDEGARQAR